MTIKLHCPNGHPVRVHEELAGRSGLCPHCGAQMRVPVLGQQADNLRRHDCALGETASSSSSPPFPLKKKTKLCVGCGKTVSQSFTICPRCGMPLSTYRHLNVQKEGEVIVVGFINHQMRDGLVIAKIAEELYNVADQAQQHLVVDLTGVVHLSSLMLEKLAMLQIRMKKKGGNLTLRKVGPEVRGIFATTTLDNTLQIEEETNASGA